MSENNPKLMDIILGFGYLFTGLIGFGRILYDSVNKIRRIPDTRPDGERMAEVRD